MVDDPSPLSDISLDSPNVLIGVQVVEWVMRWVVNAGELRNQARRFVYFRSGWQIRVAKTIILRM